MTTVLHTSGTQSTSDCASAVDPLDDLRPIDTSSEWIEPYVAALVDAHFDFSIKIGEQDTRAVGYKITHSLTYNAEGPSIIRLVDQFLTEIGIEPRIREQDETTYEQYNLTISRRADIITLLETVRPSLLVRTEAVSILLDEILLAMNAGAHSARESFVELMGTVEGFRAAVGRANRGKYDQEYFRREWGLDSDAST